MTLFYILYNPGRVANTPFVP